MVNLVNRIVVKSDIQTGLFHHLIPIIVSWKSTHGQYISCHSKSVVCYCIPLWMSTHMHVCGFGLVHPRLAAVILQGHNRSPKCTWYKAHLPHNVLHSPSFRPWNDDQLLCTCSSLPDVSGALSYCWSYLEFDYLGAPELYSLQLH